MRRRAPGVAKPSGDVRLFLRLLSLARPYKLQLPAIFGLNLLSIPLGLLAPVPLAIAIDSVLGSRPLPGFIDAIAPESIERSNGALLAFSVGLLIAVTLLLQLQDVTRSLLTTYTGERMQLDLRARLFDRAQRLSFTYHDSRGTADSIYRIQSDASSVESVAIGAITGLGTSTLSIATMMYVTFRLDWQLGIVALAVSPFLFFFSHLYRHRYRGRYREVKRIESSALGIIHEVLTGIRVVKAFGQEEREQERFIRRSQEGMSARVRLALAEQGFGALTTLMTAFGTAAVLYIGVRHVQSGALTLGHLLLVMTYIAQLYGPLKTVSKKITSLQSSLASAERAFELLDQPQDVLEAPDARPLVRAKGDIELRDVWFRYGHDPVLKGVSVSIPHGARVGIAGKTGAGKSTLASLIPRFYEPTSGRILLDGVDVSAYAVKDLRNQFAIVLQDTILFSASIAENIGYGRPDATFDEIVAAATAANAHDFIEALPEGYDTIVGERGMTLSGGERQRVALARAFLKDAPILILDEPTSSVDTKTEAVILEAIERLMVDRTTLMIAHRVGTLDICDVRLEMVDGQLLHANERFPVPSSPPEKRREAPPEPDRVSVDQAGAAWRATHPHGPAPDRILALKQRRWKHVAVFRMLGAGFSGSSIIAKRSPSTVSRVEKVVYEEVLPRSGLDGFGFYGFFEESDGQHCWLFTADLDGERYVPRRAAHQELAGRWLGLLHTATADLSESIPLPTRGSNHFFQGLHQTMRTIASLEASSTRSEDRATLASLARLLGEVDRRWPAVEDLCEALPRVLVHGDFGRKNLRLHVGADGPQLRAFDWEMSGWGQPLVDLARCPFPSERLGASPDLRAYHGAVTKRWPELTPPVIRRMSHYGSLFRCISSLSWAVQRDHNSEGMMAELGFYNRVLSVLIREFVVEDLRQAALR